MDSMEVIPGFNSSLGADLKALSGNQFFFNCIKEINSSCINLDDLPLIYCITLLVAKPGGYLIS